MSKKTDEKRGDEAQQACQEREEVEREARMKELEDKREAAEAKVY